MISGITTACEKRPVSIEEIESVKDSIIHDIQAKWDREVPSSYIGEKVMEALHRLDLLRMCGLLPCTASSRM